MTRLKDASHFSGAFFALVATLLFSAPASAIDGGALAGRNRLSQATVGIATLNAESGTIGLARCSGVLIAPRLVLTAAHCVQGNPLASLVVLYRGDKPVLPAISVTALVRHDVIADDLPPEYAELLTLSLDTAILRLATPVRGRMPIPLSHGGLPPSGLRLAGAGLSEEGIGTLKTTHLDSLLTTTTGLIVATTRGSAVCKGDSGGPVVSDGPRGPVLWGVTSAVLSRNGACGQIVVIAPASPLS